MIVLALLLAAANSMPMVLMTRSEAARSSPSELVGKLLADFPHERIIRVEVPPTVGPMPDPRLRYVLFYEEGQLIGGRFCSARRIVVTFDSIDGKVDPGGQTSFNDVPRRVFAVTAYPLLAVLDDAATAARCAAVTSFAQIPPDSPDGGRRIVAGVVEIAEQARRKGRVAVPVTCVDETRQPHTSCDGVKALAALDWKALSGANVQGNVSGPSTQLSFGGQDFWWLEVTGANQVEKLALRRSYPPPF